MYLLYHREMFSFTFLVARANNRKSTGNFFIQLIQEKGKND